MGYMLNSQRSRQYQLYKIHSTMKFILVASIFLFFGIVKVHSAPQPDLSLNKRSAEPYPYAEGADAESDAESDAEGYPEAELSLEKRSAEPYPYPEVADDDSEAEGDAESDAEGYPEAE